MDERLKQLLVLGREHYERREYDRAEAALSQVLGGGAAYADVHNMMGVIAHERGDFLLATQHFERAVDLNPGYTEALLNLVIGYNDVGQYEKARAAFERFRRSESSTGTRGPDEFALGKIANMHADLAAAYADAGCPADAERELQRAVALRPAFVDLRVKLAALYKAAGKLAEARAELEIACRMNPGYVQARLHLGVVSLAMGDKAGAAARLREVLAAEPHHRTAKLYLRLAEQPDSPPTAPRRNVMDDPTHVP